MQWVRTQSASGVPLPSLLQSMRKAGWAEHPHAARWPCPRRVLPLLAAARPEAEVAVQVHESGVPEPDLLTDPCCVHAGDRDVHVLMSVRHPRVVVFGNLLSNEECDAIIAAARPRMQRSLTVDNQSGGEAVNDDRTSNGMFFQRGENDLISRVEQRIARLLNWPLENGEGMQVLHYRPAPNTSRITTTSPPTSPARHHTQAWRPARGNPGHVSQRARAAAQPPFPM
jgi:prolyl 4-hydroxylase